MISLHNDLVCYLKKIIKVILLDNKKQQMGWLELQKWFQKHERWCLLLLIILSAVVFFVVIKTNPTVNEAKRTDDPWTITKHMINGKGYSACTTSYFPFCKNSQKLTAMREPLMVLQFYVVAKVLNKSLVAAFLVEYLLFLGVTVGLYSLVKSKFGALLACLAALIWITYQPLQSLFVNNTGDLSASFWFTIGLIFLYRFDLSRKLLLLVPAGIALGLAILSRSAMLIPTFVICGFTMLNSDKSGYRISKNSIKSALTLAITCGIVVAPWIIRNYALFDKPMLTSLSGYNLFRHNSPIQSPDYFHYVKIREANEYRDALLLSLPNLQGNEDEGQMDQIYQKAALQLIQKYPTRFLALSVYRIIPLWFNIGVPDKWTQQDTQVVIQQSIVLILFLAGILFSKPRPWMYIGCIALYCAGHMAIDGQVRYLIPIIPLILYVGMAGLHRLTSDRP